MSKARNIAALSTVEVGATADQTKADIEGLGILATSLTGNKGKVIGYSQAVLGSGVNLSNFNPSSYGTPSAIPNATITYTPVSNTSKLLVTNSTSFHTNNSGNLAWFYLGLDLHYNYSTSSPTSPTALYSRNEVLGHDFSSSTNGIWLRDSSYMSYLHDHNTPIGESITYKMYWDTDGGHASASFGTLRLNHTASENTFTIIEMET